MPYVDLGRPGVTVSRLCLGALSRLPRDERNLVEFSVIDLLMKVKPA